MKTYNIGDKVLFYVDVTRKDPVAGEIVDIIDTDLYKVLYEGSQFGVYGFFITGRIVSDKEVIAHLEEKIVNYDKKLQVLNNRIVEADAEIVRLKKIIDDQKEDIRNLTYPWRNYSYNKKPKRKGSPFPFSPYEFPDMTPRWKLDDKKIRCTCKEHMEQ